MLNLKILTIWRHKRKRVKFVEDTIWMQNRSSGGWQVAHSVPFPVMRPLPLVAHIFTLREMQEATDYFSLDNLLGEGGFGRVYRGVLGTSGKVVAIKQMDPAPSKGAQGEREFRVEVDILSRLNHPNLVQLIGYCADSTQRMLVYEFMPNGNLQEHLHGIVRVKMDWVMRVRIALGAARALEHLHSGPGTGNPVIHRDFKSSNILLDEKFQAKVSDFGLAKLVPFGNKMYVSTRVLGTFGYFDPQYTATGRLTLKSDVYGFGVVLLELLTGRKAVDLTSQNLRKQNLVSQVRHALKDKRKLRKVVDSEISIDAYLLESISRYASLASRCVRDDPDRRPSMRECSRELEQIYIIAASDADNIMR